MVFRFIHTADWQLGKPFANFPPDLAGELAAARLVAIARIAAVAREKGASHVLVAGDVFDSEGLASLALRRALEHMAHAADVAFYLLPGNHDPARPGGIWERVAAIGAPTNVKVCADTIPVEIGGEAMLLSAPLTSKAPGRDPSEWMAHAPTPAGRLRIGLAHGSVQGFGSEGDSAVVIARDRAETASLDYLALGDWHGTKGIDARTWYAGTPEPDRFPDNDPGGVLSVALEPGAPPLVERVATASFTWAKREVALRAESEFEAVERAILTLGSDAQRLIVRLSVTGALTLAARAAFETWCERLAGRLRHLEIDADKLALALSGDDLAQFGPDGALRTAAERLAALASATDGAAATARLALQRLASFSAEADGGRR